jgi:hypothetical protein
VLLLHIEDKPQRGMRLRQIAIQLHGLAREVVPQLKGRGVKKVLVPPIGPARNVGIAKGGMGAGVPRIEGKRLLEHAPHLLNFSHVAGC